MLEEEEDGQEKVGLLPVTLINSLLVVKKIAVNLQRAAWAQQPSRAVAAPQRTAMVTASGPSLTRADIIAASPVA
jgi:hypothetical protein